MTKDDPLSQVLVVGLMRTLLACCPGAPKTGVTVCEEWMSPLAYYFTLKANSYCACDECSERTHPKETLRHNFILAYYTSKLLNFLLGHLQANDVFQFAYLSQLIYEGNGIIVSLKFLNQEFSTMEPVSSPALFCFESVPPVIQLCLQAILKTCYLVCSNHPERIKDSLVNYKSSMILKKLLKHFENTSVEVHSLMLMQIQVKYLAKKWKTVPSNMRIISLVFQKLEVTDPFWLVEDSRPHLTEEEVKRMTLEYHNHHYWQHLGEEELPSSDLSEEFMQHYETWLEENVWGYTYIS